MSDEKTQVKPPILPLMLLGLMTIVMVAGPVGMTAVIRGGNSRDWPPDRPVEWVVFGVTVGVFVALMMACLSTSYWAKSRQSKM